MDPSRFIQARLVILQQTRRAAALAESSGVIAVDSIDYGKLLMEIPSFRQLDRQSRSLSGKVVAVQELGSKVVNGIMPSMWSLSNDKDAVLLELSRFSNLSEAVNGLIDNTRQVDLLERVSAAEKFAPSFELHVKAGQSVREAAAGEFAAQVRRMAEVVYGDAFSSMTEEQQAAKLEIIELVTRANGGELDAMHALDDRFVGAIDRSQPLLAPELP